MDTLLDILQAAGIGAAIGIRPFLPVLLVGALAAADLGVDFDGTDYAFLEHPVFLLVAIVGLVGFDFARRRMGEERLEEHRGLAALTGFLVAGFAGLEGAGSLDDRGHPVAAGSVAGIAAAMLALFVTRALFARVRTRLGAEAGLLPLYREGLALVVAGFSVLFPPLALLVLGALLFLLSGGQRREGEKYAGLRILR